MPKNPQSAWTLVDESAWTPVEDRPRSSIAGLPAGQDLPGVPQPSATSAVRDLPPTIGGIGATAANVGTHLKNLVAAPYHAFADAPRDATESLIADGPKGSRLNLGFYRMTAKPTVDALAESRDLRRAGGPQASLWKPSTYDAQGNNIPTAGSKLVDAVPVVGPWARNFKDEQVQKGMLPAVAGLATDVFAPKAGMGLLGKVSNKLAPVFAETAIRTRATDKAFGAKPGRAILDETTGLSPGKIAEQANSKIDELTTEKSRLARQTSARVDLSPARKISVDARSGAKSRNNGGTIKDVDKLYDQLHTEYGTGGDTVTWDGRRMNTPPTAIPSSVTAERAVDLQRGLGDLRDFSPTARSTFADQATGRAYHELGEGISGAVPEIGPLNTRTSSLLPVAKRAAATDLAAGPLQRMVMRFGAHSGAMLAGIEGAKRYGALGGIAGFVVPELLFSPESQMIAGRGLNAVGKMTESPLAKGASRAAPFFTSRENDKRKQ